MVKTLILVGLDSVGLGFVVLMSAFFWISFGRLLSSGKSFPFPFKSFEEKELLECEGSEVTLNLLCV